MVKTIDFNDLLKAENWVKEVELKLKEKEVPDELLSKESLILKDVTMISNKSLHITNNSVKECTYIYQPPLSVEDESIQLSIAFHGKLIKGGGVGLYVNKHLIPLNGTVNMEILPPLNIVFSLCILPESEVEIDVISFQTGVKAVDYVTDLAKKEEEVLVITPSYPSSVNLYACGFVHSRVQEYEKAGLKVTVAVIGNYWYQTQYNIDNINVFQGSYQDLKTILSLKKYKTILVHFIDEYLMQIFDGYIITEQLVFFCHGADVLYRMMPNVVRPYFTREHILNNDNDIKLRLFQNYAVKNNVTWIFVSEYLKNEAEKQLECQFKNFYIINNIINEKFFPYNIKTAEARKKVLMIRRFDDIRYYSIDLSVRAILYLSHKTFFKELTFDIYGDGNKFEILTKPLNQFKNVHIHRHFIPNNKISQIHEKHGILLCPSRFDTQGVTLDEAASSGLVPVGSSLPAIKEFINTDYNILADPEDYKSLGDIIERLYLNPDEFLKLSKSVSQDIHQKCNFDNTVAKEIELIKTLLRIKHYPLHFENKISETPTLTIVVPAYNIAPYIDKCLYSLLNHRNVFKTEILLINDGSKDETLKIAQEYEKFTNGIVRVIDKQNGGHGSTINKGIEEAKGKYFRLIDGDDWVDSENLAKQIDILEKEDVDLILTKGCYEYVEKPQLVNIIDYDFLNEGTEYLFDDLVYPHFGFNEYGPLLTTGTYKTQCLKAGHFKITEKKPYVDMEFNAFSILKVNSLKYYNLDIYRYLIGRAGQTVSRDFWKKKYMDHREIIESLLLFVNSPNELTVQKRKYIREHLLCQMIDSQIFMYDQLCMWESIDDLLSEIRQKDKITYKAGINYIKNKNGDCKVILDHYKNAIKYYKQRPKTKKISLTGSDSIIPEEKNIFIVQVKKVLRTVSPYGVVQFYRRIRFGD